MKKIVLTLAVCFAATLLHAQPKPSQRSFAEEVRKIQDRKAARSRMLGTQGEQQSPSPAVPLPANKPSERPVKVPARPARQE